MKVFKNPSSLYVAFSLILFMFFICLVSDAASQEIVYASNADGTYDIWSISSDGTNKENLSMKSHDLFGEFYEEGPKWSPDGKKIAFRSNKSGCLNIWIMDADGQNDYNLTNIDRAEVSPFWSPDGTKIYFGRNTHYCSGAGCAPCRYWEIYVHNLVTGIETQLTFNSYREMYPAVSPGGDFITYTKAESPNDCCNPTDIWIMNSDGANQQLLYGYSDGKYEWISDWGKVNNKILIAKHWDCGNPSCHEVTLIDPDGSNVVRLTNNNYQDYPYVFSSDGQEILVYSERSGYSDIWIMDINGTYLYNLTNDSASEVGADWKQNRPPVAVCQDIEISADENCQAGIVAEDVDGGSYDPDEGDSIELSVDNLGPFPLGEHYINLTVTDEHGAFDTCQAKVTVVDAMPPVITLSDPICVNVGKGKGKMANKITVSAVDNCSLDGDLTIDLVEIFNNGGQLVKGKGVYDIAGNDIYVYPNGKGWSICVTATAIDGSGNLKTDRICKSLLKCKK